MNNFYVYVYFRPNGIPCYVGKGRRYRWLAHERRTTNKHLYAIIKKAGGTLPKVKVREGLTEQEAFVIESALIQAIGREVVGGPLVNFTDGGEGSTGYTWSDKTRKKDEARVRTVETGAKISAQRKADKVNLERLRALGRAKKGVPLDDSVKAKLSVAHKANEEFMKRCREWGKSHRGVPKSPAHKEAIRASCKAAYERRINQ